MTNRTIRGIGAGVLVAVWLGLALAAWFGPAEEISESERRKLAQFPQLSGDTVLSGDFMSDFEAYTLDQFPMRDSFRRMKALFHYNVLRQGDNNGIYMAGGYAAKLEYPLNEASLRYAGSKLNRIYEKYLRDSGSAVYLSVVPDKSCYLASDNGYPALDYDALIQNIRQQTPWASYIDLTGCLSASDYYRTDTHWRQERLLPAAQALCGGLGVPGPAAEDYRQTALERPFYGVYYGQAALPMEPETMYLLESDIISGCTVLNHETGKTTSVYDMEKLASQDLYDVYLSGAVSLLTIENPNAETDRELILFRDSFGSSVAPLLLQGYRTVTLVDIRYVSCEYLDQFIDFHGQDVLFLYSTLVLNNSSTLK